MGGRERHVVGHDRLGEALEGKRTYLFGGNASLERNVDSLAEQYLAVLSLSTEPSRDIAHRADRGDRVGWRRKVLEALQDREQQASLAF